MSRVTHKELVVAAEKWLKNNGFKVAISELVCNNNSGEIPDSIGFNSYKSCLIECKISREDFLKDAKKYFRQEIDVGMGNYRLYLCPTNIISQKEVPKGWGLLYYDNNKRVKRIIMPKSNIWNCEDSPLKYFNASLIDERCLLVSALRRKL